MNREQGVTTKKKNREEMFVFFVVFFKVETLNKDSEVKRGKTENELTKVIGARINRPLREKKNEASRSDTHTVLTRPQKTDTNLRRYFIQV